MYDIEDFLVRRGVNPNAIRQRILDVNSLVDKFKLGESGPLNTPYRPNFTLGQGRYNPVYPVSTNVYSQVGPRQIGTSNTTPQMIAGAKQPLLTARPTAPNPNLDTLYGRGTVNAQQAFTNQMAGVRQPASAQGGTLSSAFKAQSAPGTMESPFKSVKIGNPLAEVAEEAAKKGRMVKSGAGGALATGIAMYPLVANWNKPGSNWQSRVDDFLGGIGTLGGTALGVGVGSLLGHPIWGGTIGGLLGELLNNGYSQAKVQRWANMTPEQLENDIEFQNAVRSELKGANGNIPTAQDMAQAKQIAKQKQQIKEYKREQEKKAQEGQTEQGFPGQLYGSDYIVDPFVAPAVNTTANDNVNVDKYIDMQKQAVQNATNELNREGGQTVVNEQAKKDLAFALMNRPIDYSAGYTPADIQYLQTVNDIARAQQNNQYEGWVADPLRRAHVARYLGMKPDDIWGNEALSPQQRLDKQIAYAKLQYDAQKSAEQRARDIRDIGNIALAYGGTYLPESFIQSESNRNAVIDKIIGKYATEGIETRMTDLKARNDLQKQYITNMGNLLRTDLSGTYGNDRAYLSGYYNTANQNANRMERADEANLRAEMKMLEIAHRSPKVSPADKMYIEGAKLGYYPWEDVVSYIQNKYGDSLATGAQPYELEPLNINPGPAIQTTLPQAPTTGPSSRASKYY